MPLQSYAAEIKLAHVATVLLSGGLLLLRGILVQAGRSAWALSAPLRYASYLVDSLLLAAALLLLKILPTATYANGWLAVKLLLLPAYVCFGWLALRGGRTWRARLGYLVAAALLYLAMLSVARSHDPLGGMRGWLVG